MSKSPAKRVFLWTVPRSLSTVLLKCLSSIKDMQVINEPYVSAYYYGPQRKCDSAVEEEFVNAYQGVEESVTDDPYIYEDDLSSYQWIKDMLEADYKGKDLVFCKDHAYCFNDLYNMLPVGYQHTFLIRHPQKSFISLMKITEKITGMDMSKMKTTADFPDPIPHGYQRLHKLMVHLVDQGEPQPIIIDADDLQSHPESIVQQYCEATGLPFNPSLLQWTPGPQAMDSWIASKRSKGNNYLPDGGFYSSAFKCSSFRPPNPLLEQEQVPKELLNVIDESLPFYESMFKLRIKP